MSTRDLHAPPLRGSVARELFRTVGLSLRAEMVLVALGAAWGTGVMIYAFFVDPHYVGIDMVPEIALPFLALAFVAPLAVWKGQGPSRRGYLLAMPVPRQWHELSRSAAGLLWVLAGLLVYLLWMQSMVLLLGGETSVEYARLFLGDDWQSRSPADFLLAVWTIPAWQWAVPFVAATAVYLIGSALVLAVDRPLLWAIGTLFLAMVAGMVVPGSLERSIEIVVLGKVGIATLLTGDAFHVLDIAALTTRAPTPSEQGTFDTILHARDGGTVVHRIPDLQAWLLSALLWLGGGAAATAAAVRLRRHDVG